MKNTLGHRDIKEMVKVVVSAKDDKVIGFHMVGSEAAEIMQVLIWCHLTLLILFARVGATQHKNLL